MMFVLLKACVSPLGILSALVYIVNLELTAAAFRHTVEFSFSISPTLYSPYPLGFISEDSRFSILSKPF